ncbi:ATP-binding cassette sub-family G member 4-like [Uranotaenia lowii]|uniref:ATP-binding cassette sub-family G member 4-like n=1 Tax=Uranotaenia lowii TaxID=190385 RepID=UPI00247897AB|nr:ATP-binding cassette sub-family G member 4-like [Uranotaenia lowii]
MSRASVASTTNLPQRSPINITFKDLSYKLSHKKGPKVILKSLNGRIRSGELTAIMGPSGAGKSTLMNILAGYKTSHVTGLIQINNNKRELAKFHKLSCYIMQEDQLMPYLTVRESMMVACNLKLEPQFDKQYKLGIIEEIIEMLGLKVAGDTQAVDLSGGQRKRLAIALELVNNPPVMFFDEPTSGLDSATCTHLIDLLQFLARGGRTIVCTIHQPSARLFEMFDHLYVLAEGQCIYQGVSVQLVPFLASVGLKCPSYHNPANYVMEIACGEHGNWNDILVAAVKDGRCADITNISSNRFPKSVSIADETLMTVVPLKRDDSELSFPVEEDGQKGMLEDDSNMIDLQEDSEKSLGSRSIEVSRRSSLVDAGLMAAKAKPDERASTTCSLKLGSSFLVSKESGIVKRSASKYPISEFGQFWILLKRTILSVTRDQALTQMRLIAHVIVGAFIGMIYYDIGQDASKISSNVGCIFFTVMFMMFTAMMPTILIFPRDMAVFVREHLNYWYSLRAFYLAKVVADMPVQIILTSGYVIVVYYLTSQPNDFERAFMFVFICVEISLVAQSVGLLIGAGMEAETAVFLGPVSAIPIILFSGFFVNFRVIPKYLQWLTYVSYLRYGFEGAMLAIYGMDREELQGVNMFCFWRRKPDKFLEEMAMEDAEYWIDALALFGFFIGMRVIGYFVLRWKLYSLR